MAFEYFDIEDFVVDKLTADEQCSSLFDAVPIPDSQEEYQRGLIKPRVTVAFSGSTQRGLRTTDIISYEEELTVVCNIQSKTLRGNIGCHHIARLIARVINGTKLQGQQMIFKDYQPSEQMYEPNNKLWFWDLSFTLRKMRVQEVEEDDSVGTYKDVTLRQSYQ